MTGPYAQAARSYWAGGWPNPIPVRAKKYPVEGYTGYPGASVSYADLTAWTDGLEANHNIALRMAGTIGIDVDAHDGERGGESIARAQARLGELPPTWSVTARGQGESRILLYKLPVGCGDLNRELQYAEKHFKREFGENVDFLHRGHRYAVVWPSIHPEIGEVYRWYLPNGQISADIPKMSELVELPITWWDFLTAPLPDAVEPGEVEPEERTSSIFGPIGADNARSVEQAAALVIRDRDAFVALTGTGNGRTQKLNNLALLAGHGVPVFWSADAAEETLIQAARDNGYVGEHGERTARVQIQRGLADGARDPWSKREVTYTQELPPDPVPTGRLRKALLRRSEIHALPDPEPLIEGVLYKNSVTVLAGKFGTYKSFVAVSWAASLATGVDWFGHKVPRPVSVIYAAAEGAYGIKRRLDAWEKAHRSIPDTLHLIAVSARLNRPADMVELREIIEETKAEVLIFDTLHASTPGVDENDSGQMGLVLETLRSLPVTSILPHHTGHAGERSRGSSSIEDDADDTFVIKIEGESREPDNPRTLVHRKTKDAATGAPVTLRLKLVEGTGSGYVCEADAFEAGSREERAPDIGQVRVIQEPQSWTHRYTRPDGEIQRRILQVLADVAGTVGRTEAQVLRAVADRWHEGKIGGKTGMLRKSNFERAWIKAIELRREGGDPVICRLDGQKYGLDPLSIMTEIT